MATAGLLQITAGAASYVKNCSMVDRWPVGCCLNGGGGFLIPGGVLFEALFMLYHVYFEPQLLVSHLGP